MSLVLVFGFFVLQVAERNSGATRERRVQVRALAHLAAQVRVDFSRFVPNTTLAGNLWIGSSEDRTAKTFVLDVPCWLHNKKPSLTSTSSTAINENIRIACVRSGLRPWVGLDLDCFCISHLVYHGHYQAAK